MRLEDTRGSGVSRFHSGFLCPLCRAIKRFTARNTMVSIFRIIGLQHYPDAWYQSHRVVHVRFRASQRPGSPGHDSCARYIDCCQLQTKAACQVLPGKLNLLLPGHFFRKGSLGRVCRALFSGITGGPILVICAGNKRKESSCQAGGQQRLTTPIRSTHHSSGPGVNEPYFIALRPDPGRCWILPLSVKPARHLQPARKYAQLIPSRKVVQAELPIIQLQFVRQNHNMWR